MAISLYRSNAVQSNRLQHMAVSCRQIVYRSPEESGCRFVNVHVLRLFPGSLVGRSVVEGVALRQKTATRLFSACICALRGTIHLPVGAAASTRDTLPQQAPHTVGWPFAFLLTPARVLGRLARLVHRRGPAPMGGS